MYIKLLQGVTHGFPTTCDGLDSALKPYWKECDHLYHDGEVVLLIPRTVALSALQRDVLAYLHDSHHGVEATKRRVCQIVWWPGINSDTMNVVRRCRAAQVF